MNAEETNEDDGHKPVMLFGRDITRIPCFRNSMLYGIYGGLGLGLFTFMFTSRPRQASHVALGSYMGITLIYWFYCRYDHVQQKYAINDIRMLLERKYNVDTAEEREPEPVDA